MSSVETLQFWNSKPPPMAKDKPLLVSGPLIQPVRTGSKTETRRLNGLDWLNELPDSWEFVGMNGKTASFQKYEGKLSVHVNCPYGEHGATIWVRENWCVGRGYNEIKAGEIPKADHVKRWYMADGIRPEWAGRIRPSIHMPKWVCRLFLEVVSVKVERLHAITEEAAKREGVIPDSLIMVNAFPQTWYREAFRLTWIKLNGQESWDLNPWVWVVSFKLKTQ